MNLLLTALAIKVLAVTMVKKALRIKETNKRDKYRGKATTFKMERSRSYPTHLSILVLLMWSS